MDINEKLNQDEETQIVPETDDVPMAIIDESSEPEASETGPCEPEPQQPERKPKKRRAWKWILWILFILLLAGGGVAGYFYYLQMQEDELISSGSSKKSSKLSQPQIEEEETDSVPEDYIAIEEYNPEYEFQFDEETKSESVEEPVAIGLQKPEPNAIPQKIQAPAPTKTPAPTSVPAKTSAPIQEAEPAPKPKTGKSYSFGTPVNVTQPVEQQPQPAKRSYRIGD